MVETGPNRSKVMDGDFMYSVNKMQEAVNSYLREISAKFHSGHAVEHAYRPALQRLMESFEDTEAINDPSRSEHGAPDFVFLRKSNQTIIKGYAEAKDIGKNLDKVEKDEQMARYAGYTNLVLTDYLEFRFMKNGVKYQTISLGERKNGELILHPEEGERLTRELHAFFELVPERIRSGKRLSTIMGAKARRIRDNVRAYLLGDPGAASDLLRIYELMRQTLVHDLSKDKFADMYAQTLVYGLFVARYGDASPETFNRAEARDLVPKSNPFLREFFDHIAGAGFESRLAKIVDELCEIFRVSDVLDIVHKHLRIQDDSFDEKDPIIHFYEDFLQAYDPDERRDRGAYYTPVPVVKFIVRNIDMILKGEFDVAGGLASNETVKYQVNVGQPIRKDQRFKATPLQTLTEPKVQILDPAVGTATFLNETIKHVHGTFKGQEGRWPAFARDNLVKRLYGFELMMAPYTIAHLKLGMTLKELGVGDLPNRLNILLTNTLEEGVPMQPDLFSIGLAEAISEESRLAAEVKSEKPVMVVMGNPPYKGISSNESPYANSLVQRYKVEPGGQEKLQERKHWLNDDYVKFLAFAEQMIERNGNGVIGMITNNGYLNNPTFRGMRWRLAKTFDKIYVLDLHGDPKKLDRGEDGGADENVFNITQGVGIILAIKNGRKDGEFAEVFHSELYGTRDSKFRALNEGNIKWQPVKLRRRFNFVPSVVEESEEYLAGVALNQLFMVFSNAAASARDAINFAFDSAEIERRMEYIRDHSEDEIRTNFGIKKDRESRDWTVPSAKQDVMDNYDPKKIAEFMYRPFDVRYSFYSGTSRGMYSSPQSRALKNIDDNNPALMVNRKVEQKRPFADVLVTNMKAQYHSLSIKETNSIAPLYLIEESGERRSNLHPIEVKKLTKNLSKTPTPEQILHYIYAVLHSPSFRDENEEALKTDFPIIPVIASDEELVRLVRSGSELMSLHLMKGAALKDLVTTYPLAGDDIVEAVRFEGDRVYINKHQYFGGVPESAWTCYVGGYQPAQRWLKDRKGRGLSDADLTHYQRVIKVLIETQRIMDEIG